MYSKDVVKIIKRLQGARLSLMKKQPFYAVLLLHMQFSLDPMCETAYTDGTRIAFCPDFLEKLSDRELEFVMMHEVMHAALNHCGRTQEQFDFDDFNTACDIVVNSNILQSCNNDLSFITLRDYGVSMHLAPDGKEGYNYTAEELYWMLSKGKAKQKSLKKRLRSKYLEDDEPSEDAGDIEGDGDFPEAPVRNDGGFDDHTYWGDADENGGSGQPSDEEEQQSDAPSCGTGAGEGDDSDEPGGEKGSKVKMQGGTSGGKGGGSSEDSADGNETGDKESGNSKSDSEKSSAPNKGHENTYNDGASSSDKASEIGQIWLQRMVQAAQIARQIIKRDSSGTTFGSIPAGAERLIRELTEPQTDWKTVLENFIQEEINDYSFNPPDRRFQDSPFLLPDFNEKDDSVKDLLFMIDTSASMSDQMITQAYSEIKGALYQFDGHLTGWLGFFDAEVVEPEEFTDEDEFMIIRPKGCGGTNFHCIFEYIKDHIDEGFEPADIIILTDGYAPFPPEEAAMGIPVLWIINNDSVDPPWGKVARIKIEETGEPSLIKSSSVSFLSIVTRSLDMSSLSWLVLL